MRRRLVAMVALAALAPLPALAAKFRLPLDDCDAATQCLDSNKCYITAYFDLNNAAGTLADWGCGQATYDGHRGTDIGIGGWSVMDSGSRAIVAGADGTVLVAQDGLFDRQTDFSACPSPGNYVALKHADGKITAYLHMKKGTVAVTAGQTVKCGAVLGYVGSSGCSTGPHLHFEVDLNGAAFAGADDPFAAKQGCGGPLSYFVDQGAYCGIPGACCESGCPTATVDNAVFESETVPDGTHFASGASFVKTWTMKNTGSATWSSPGYQWTFDGQEQFGAPGKTALAAGETIASGATKVWSVSMKAPAKPSTYRGYFRTEHVGKARFGDRAYVEIVVDPPKDQPDFDADGHESIAAGGDDCNDTDPDIYPGHPEVCDGKDNDCDGADDDGLTRVCESQCGPGTESCVNGKFQGCSGPQPRAEECNGIDDDCDGRIDDGASCPSGMECVLGTCTLKGGAPDAGSTPSSPDAAVMGSDAAATAPDGGRPVGPDDPVVSGGCGCAAGAGLPLLALPALVALRRRRGARLEVI